MMDDHGMITKLMEVVQTVISLKQVTIEENIIRGYNLPGTNIILIHLQTRR
jgi:hypothetical protein